MNKRLLKSVLPGNLPSLDRQAVSVQTLRDAALIVDDVRARGEVAVREHAERLGDIRPGEPLVIGRDVMQSAFFGLSAGDREVLERAAQRIRVFAEAQRASISQLFVPVEGGYAGHDIRPMDRAGCYVPGGRYPLPSSALMTAVTARAAGVESVWAASPRPAPVTLAAAYIAGVDSLLAVGGAQAIGAMAYGAGSVLPCDVIVGPGNRWVTAAKRLVGGDVAIDMLAGPSELIVFADDSADPAWVAADMLAQAEHDPDAMPILVTTSDDLVERVDGELLRQLEQLSTAAVASRALDNGFCIVVRDVGEGAAICNRLAPEHLEIMFACPEDVVPMLYNYGALFIGARSAEVFGDYGAGPNHVLPTGGTARHTGGLSVFTFLRVRTWLRIDNPDLADQMARDAVAMAGWEGLSGHAASAACRLK